MTVENPMPYSSPAEPVPEADVYSLWVVLRTTPAGANSRSSADTCELDDAVASLQSLGVTVRGFYDVSGFRAVGDLMIWLHGHRPELLQRAYRQLRRTRTLSGFLPTWNAMGVHRPAEFSPEHRPAFMKGTEPEAWITVYPFVRSHEWYLLPDEQRRRMLAGHGRQGARHPEVLANTVAGFALGDYEWVLAFEAPELVELVDLMRDLRYTDARRHVRQEVPFHTGRRISTSMIEDLRVRTPSP